MGDEVFYADLIGIAIVENKLKRLERSILDSTPFDYVSPSDYDVSVDYDISDIKDKKRKEIGNSVKSFRKEITDLLGILIEADERARALLAAYGNLGYFDIPDDYDPTKPSIVTIGNSYYYYEAYPEMIKRFFNNDVNVDIAISSRIGLQQQQALLDAARRGDKEEFNRLFNNYIYENLDDEAKKYISKYMTDHNVKDGEATSMAYEYYRRSATRPHDAVVVEGMSLDKEANIDALKKIIEKEKEKNPNVVIIVDDFTGIDGDELAKRLKEETGVEVKVTRARHTMGEVKSAFGESKNSADPKYRAGGHPNKVSSYTNAKVAADIISEVLDLEMNKNYDGDTTGAHYCDSTYGVIQEPRNNYKDSNREKGSTDSGTDDKTDNYPVLTPEDIEKVDKIVENEREHRKKDD